jgi:DNA invertase Pin-like site-specific DNA recombinase
MERAGVFQSQIEGCRLNDSMQIGLRAPRVRCATYTRVSNDERLDQEFNSLHAQTQACISYIESQRALGWVAIERDFCDPGYSGGNTDRPGFQRLMKAVQNGDVDLIVVYKIDRLSRSLADLSRMIEVFDRHNVSFASVTQAFNTSTASGRLMLNTLTTFGQFEREVISERIRDKISAAKRKGYWQGGVPAFGYDVRDKKLVINDAEAVTVLRVFRDMLTIGSTTKIAALLNAEGITTKSWTTQKGVQRTGGPIDKKYLYALLRNRIYLGEISLKGSWHPAQHEAIIDTGLWGHVHAILAKSPQVRSAQTQGKARTDSLLRGLLFDPLQNPMYATYAMKSGKKYRYYVSKSEMKNGAASKTHARLPAGEIEGAVVAQIKTVLGSPEAIGSVCNQIKQGATKVDEARIVLAMGNLGNVWEQLFQIERHRIVNLMIERVDLVQDGLKVKWRPLGWQELLGEFAPKSIGSELVEMESLS